jgi:hypothetical protein
MRIKLALGAVAAITAFSMLPASAQTAIPAVVLTVPVKATALDGEAFKTLYVACIVHDGTHVLAVGESAVPLVVVPATPTVRSSASFSGNVTVSLTSTNTVGAAYKASGKDPETLAMSDAAATIKEIGKSGQYQCALTSVSRVNAMKPLDTVGSTLKTADPKTITETVNGKSVQATTATVLVEGKLTP